MFRFARHKFPSALVVCVALAVCLIPVLTASSEENDALDLPKIVKTLPAIGATDVPAHLKQIEVTFDRDMLPGYSWLSGPSFPEITGKPLWKNNRTCILPVKLDRGRFYRVGINGTDRRFQSFTSEDAVPAPPRVIWFVTEGATEREKAKSIAPKLVSIIPKNGQKDVDPSLQAIEVRFDKPMSKGMSWTTWGAKFPRGSGMAYWKDDGVTCVFPVALEPDREYEVGINSAFYNNFQSADGVPVEPFLLKFKTRGDVAK